MLVLTRKTQQRIQIGEDVSITIVRIQGNRVRVGIEAPDGVRVVRGELGERSDADASTGRGGTDRACGGLAGESNAGAPSDAEVGRCGLAERVERTRRAPPSAEPMAAYAV